MANEGQRPNFSTEESSDGASSAQDSLTAPSTSSVQVDSESSQQAPSADATQSRKLAGFELDARFAFWLVLGCALGLVVPFLGSIGFFDPWETHYAEVARQMAARDDYLYPFWKDAYFFSKPVLLFWLTSIGYKIIGAGEAVDAIPAAAEWVGRLPSALISICTVVTVFFTASRLWSRRAGVISALALTTIPFWLFLSRQAITDMLYVGPMSMALCLLAIAFLHDESREELEAAKIPLWMIVVFGLSLFPQFWEFGRTGAFLNRVTWLGDEMNTRVGFSLLLCGIAAFGLYLLWRKGRDPLVHGAAFWVAIATLGKGPHALLLTGMVLFLYFLVSWEWERLRRPALITGILLYVTISLPWYLVMTLFEGRDESRKTWFTRFVLWDLLGRIGSGVHGDRGTFEYYLRYLAFGMFPWSGFFPLALLKAVTAPLGSKSQRTTSKRFTLFVALWAAGFFVFFTATTTKFHHYIFPVVVPAALLIGWWLDDLLRSSKRIEVGLATVLVLGSILIARDLAAEPWQLIDLFTYHYKSWKPDYYFPVDVNWHLWMGIATFATMLLFAQGVVRDQLSNHFSAKTNLADVHTDASDVTDQASRIVPTPGPSPRAPNENFVVGSLLAACFFSIFVVHVYFNRMSQHWSQRWIFDTYYAMRQPGEPLISYQMDWKGETFYSHNSDIQIKKSATDLKKRVSQPGREFILVQTDRFNRIESALGATYKSKIKVVDRSNKKWFLVLVEE